MCNEGVQLGVDLVADFSKRGEAEFVGALDGGGIFKAPVDALGVAGEDGAGVAGVVADGEDVIELVAEEFIDGLGSMNMDWGDEVEYSLELGRGECAA